MIETRRRQIREFPAIKNHHLFLKTKTSALFLIEKSGPRSGIVILSHYGNFVNEPLPFYANRLCMEPKALMCRVKKVSLWKFVGDSAGFFAVHVGTSRCPES